jgi:hypothetical protein
VAELRLAGEKAKAGDKAGALADFDAVAGNSSVAGPLRDLAQARGALLALDMGDLDGARSRAEPLNQAGNPWRHVAREVLGTAAYKSGDLAKSRDIFSEIQEDAETPPDLWIRSGLMISLISGQLAAPATDGADAGAAAPAEAPPSAGSAPSEPGAGQ